MNNQGSVIDSIKEKLWEFEEDTFLNTIVEPYAIFCDMRTYAEIYEQLETNTDPYYIYLNNRKLKLITEHPKNGLVRFEILYKLK